MIRLSVAAISGFTLLYKEGPGLMFLGSFFYCFEFRLVSTNHLEAMDYYKLAIVLLDKFVLIIHVIFKFLFQQLDHSIAPFAD